MPPLERPERPQPVRLPPRRALLGGETDVLVVGGGPAGLGAALGAARAGARVILAERYGFLGGNATAALVMPLMSYHTDNAAPTDADPSALLPRDHGAGEPVVGGVLTELVERLVAAGGAVAPSPATGFTVPFDPEVLKTVALALLDEAGVSYLLHAFGSGVTGRGRVNGAVFETKSGAVVLRAKALVDATGDGDVAARAGAPFEVGRPEDGLVQPMTLMFRVVGFDRGRFQDYAEGHPAEWRGVHGLWDLVRQAREAGELHLAREDVLFFATPHEGELGVNTTRITGVLGNDPWDATRAEREGRRQLEELAAFFRSRVPGFEKAYVVQSGPQVGVRETRRVLGDYRLTAEDVLGARKFDDAVARGSYPVDIHDPKGPGTVLRKLPPGESYDIPLRCLLPRRVEGLLVAGRCISGTHEAHSSYRSMPTSVATGQAAGVCAALASREDHLPRGVPPEDVRAELRRQGAKVR